jgi:Na+/H+ antiporter NhaD/arsenite permease-like protein
MIVAEIFAANTGGAATMSGDPPNIIIGTSLGYNFVDFIVNTGLIAWICMVIAGVYFYFILRKSLSQGTAPEEMMKACPYPGTAISSRGMFMVSIFIFIVTIALIITHANTGLSVALIGVIAAVMTLFAHYRDLRLIFKAVNWQTLVFFIGLFIIVGGLESTGVLQKIAQFISNTSGGKPAISIGIILWLSAFASALVDNIPFAATMVPIIKDLSVVGGMTLPPLAWALALGTDLGGNGTPIGASANVVGTSVAHKEGYPVTWGRFIKIALPPMLITVAVCHVLLLIRYT